VMILDALKMNGKGEAPFYGAGLSNFWALRGLIVS
jgi:hypothetical protein